MHTSPCLSFPILAFLSWTSVSVHNRLSHFLLLFSSLIPLLLIFPSHSFSEMLFSSLNSSNILMPQHPPPIPPFPAPTSPHLAICFPPSPAFFYMAPCFAFHIPYIFPLLLSILSFISFFNLFRHLFFPQFSFKYLVLFLYYHFVPAILKISYFSP